MEVWQQPRIQERIAVIKSAQDESRRLALIKQLFREIQAASASVINKMDEGTVITNLDEVTTAFHNELKQNTSRLLMALKDLKLSNEEQSQISMAVQKDALGTLQDEFQTIRVKKNRDRVEVTNLHEMGYPSELRMNNIEDFKPFFESLEKKIETALKINIEAPQVNVEAPQVNVESPTLNVPEIEFQPVIQEIKSGLTKIRNNNKSNPIFVRLTDLEAIINKLEDLRKGQMTALSGFPNQMYIKGPDGSIISPHADIGNVLKTFVNISASTTDGSIVAAVTGKIIRVISLAMVAGATATNITFNSKPAGAGTAISALFANGANGGAVLPFNEKGWIDTNSGEGLTATTGTGATTGIQIVYQLV